MEPPARNQALSPGLWGRCTRRAGLRRSDTCVPVSRGGPSVAGHLPHEHPQTHQWWRLGGLSVPPRPRPPLHCPLRDGAFTSLPGTPKAGGESGRFSASGTHTIICNGFGRGRPRLNWDFSWPATVELFLRYWAACASWQVEVISFFLSAFYAALASPLITVTRERQELGTTSANCSKHRKEKSSLRTKEQNNNEDDNKKQKPQQTLNLTRKMEKEAILPLFYHRKAFFFFFSFSSSL